MEENQIFFKEPDSSLTTNIFNSGNFVDSVTNNNTELALSKSDISLTEINSLQTATTEPKNAEILIQAEDYTNFFDTTPGNKGSQYRNDDVDIQNTKDIGGGYNVSSMRKGEWLEYQINIPDNTNYDLEIRTASLSDRGKFNIQVDGEDRTNIISVDSTGGKQNWETLKTSLGQINEGSHTLRFQVQDSKFKVNWLRLLPSVGEPNQPSELFLEAENYIKAFDTTSGNRGGEYRSDNVDIAKTSDVGGGYNIGWIDNNEWLEYSINVPATANYQAEARIASKNSGGAFTIEVDGKKLGDFSVDSTGGKQNWQSLTSSLGSISAGNHTLRVQVQKGKFNLNWLNLSEETTISTPTLPTPGLNPNVAPSSNFDLKDWYISIPIDKDKDGRADSISESKLSNGFEDKRFFYTNPDGGMVFKATVDGYKTSSNTEYTRTELREMLRQGDTSYSTQGVGKNNWVFSSAPNSAQKAAGGVDGELTATLAVNHVTTTGSKKQVGRVIVGQIHTHDDEPVRLYYRKLPGNSKGSIYMVHETLGGDDNYYELIGNRSDKASNPKDGIALDEKFSYNIKVIGDNLEVTIMRPGKSDVVQTVDMTNSGYDDKSQYMYFKAGVYNQNNTGRSNDYVQATFYALDNKHNSYRDSSNISRK